MSQRDEAVPFLLPPLSPSPYRSPPASPGSFNFTQVFPPTLKRSRRTLRWSVAFFAFGFLGVVALGSYSWHTNGTVTSRLRTWHSSFSSEAEGDEFRAASEFPVLAPHPAPYAPPADNELSLSPSTATSSTLTSELYDTNERPKSLARPNSSVVETEDVGLYDEYDSTLGDLNANTVDTAENISSTVLPVSQPEPTSSSSIDPVPPVPTQYVPPQDTMGSILVSALPRPRRPTGGKDEKFIGFLTHSGFHNQRIELENALMLGKLLGRTVLIPPVWIGWPTPTKYYDELQSIWSMMVLMNPPSFNLTADPDSLLHRPANYSSTVDYPGLEPPYIDEVLVAKIKADHAVHMAHAFPGMVIRPDGYPITNLTSADCKSYSIECRHTYKDTFLSWDFLFNLDSVGDAVRIVDRFDIRESAVESLLGVTADDVFVVKDSQRYDFQFVDQTFENNAFSRPDNSKSHFMNQISIPAIAALPQKVILVGSLFGTSRVVPAQDSASRADALQAKEIFEESMAFRNEWLMRPTLAINRRLGGMNNYVGIHARIGDGVFMREASKNMENAFRKLTKKMRVGSKVTERIWQLVKPEKTQHGRRSDAVDTSLSSWAHLDDVEERVPDSPTLPRMDRELHRRAPPPLAAYSGNLVDLNCRAPLHTDPSLLAFNIPLYLATDSRSPTTDPVLAIFFEAFPCTFILSDFDRSTPEINFGVTEPTVGEMTRLVNKADQVSLGRLMIPFLEAMIAAMGSLTVGTQGSTFSGYASGPLHNAYVKDSLHRF